ncbi:MAG: 50S ribosomal protein L11 methyltransferase [Nitrospirae bacterium]|nr:50S ribosomal protein L11 methyltransferase [Nitrospirota bacterium]
MINNSDFFYKVTIGVHPENAETVSSMLFDLGCNCIEEKEKELISYFPSETDTAGIEEAMRETQQGLSSAGLFSEIPYTIEEIASVDWNETWKKGIEPVPVGKRLIMLASWHSYDGERERVIIDPGMAFGTGHHPSTKLCLDELESFKNPEKECLLDLGAGSGILAISASKLGFKRVTAVDNDPVAIEAVKENAIKNNIRNIAVVYPDIRAVSGLFSVIVANLTSETIKDILDDLFMRMDKNGKVILSGILQWQAEDLIRQIKSKGIKNIKTTLLDGWVSICFGGR